MLYRCDADGRNIRPLSSNIEHDNTPWPLPDGRVLYMRWEYVDRSQVRLPPPVDDESRRHRPDGLLRQPAPRHRDDRRQADPRHATRSWPSSRPGHGQREHDGRDHRRRPARRARRAGVRPHASARARTSATRRRSREDCFLAASGPAARADGRRRATRRTLYQLPAERRGGRAASATSRGRSSPRPREPVDPAARRPRAARPAG